MSSEIELEVLRQSIKDKFLSSCIFKFLHLLIRNKKGEDLPDSWESQQENTRNPSPPVTKVLDTNKCVCEGGGHRKA